MMPTDNSSPGTTSVVATGSRKIRVGADDVDGLGVVQEILAVAEADIRQCGAILGHARHLQQIGHLGPDHGGRGVARHAEEGQPHGDVVQRETQRHVG